jgi:hypothetical protein
LGINLFNGLQPFGVKNFTPFETLDPNAFKPPNVFRAKLTAQAHGEKSGPQKNNTLYF